jgi:hypothetical protein
MVIELDHMFRIEVTGGDNAYADTPEQALKAYWQLQRDRGTQGTTAKIINIQTGKVVISD